MSEVVDDLLPEDWCTFRKFRDELPNFHSSDDSLRWDLRHREKNGLIEEGVVIEKRADPSATRPSLLISPSRYIRWLKNRARHAA